MNEYQGHLHFVANNTLTLDKGPSAVVETLPNPADQLGHKHPPVAQPSWKEIAPKLESPEVKARIADMLSRYPEAQGALLEVLWIAQEALGWVPREAIRWAAGICGCSPAHAFGVATFYTMYKHAPTGRFLLQFCRNISCHVMGAPDVIGYTERALNIKTGGTTPDGLFTLVQVECLGACGNGPVMLVNDEFATDVENGKLTLKPGVGLTSERIDKILKWCYAREAEFKVEPSRDALGGVVNGHKGHPGAPGASAKSQVADYAPPCPILGVKAVASEAGVTLTWKGAPEFTQIAVERLEGTSWKSIGAPGLKDKEFIDATGKAGSEYRMIATSGARVAKPSAVAKAIEKAG